VQVVEQIRAGRIEPPRESAAAVIAAYRDLDGELLGPRVAAVELLNVPAADRGRRGLRHVRRPCAAPVPRLPAGSPGRWDGAVERFVQEVRRFYPFFPAVVARVRNEFEWKGYRFPAGTRTMLDLYGTHHDPRAWEAPEEFRPERFRRRDGSPFGFIPQGGGDPGTSHRCPGEWITIELMKVALDFLADRLTYDVPEQDLRIDVSRLPALPRSRLVLSDVGSLLSRRPSP
jgi:fatty-acid peroxygenase